MLLRLAGHGPDDLLARARGWLAEERYADLARAAAFAVAAQRVPLHPAGAALLGGLPAGYGHDPATLDRVRRAGAVQVMPYVFALVEPAAVRAARDSGAEVPGSLDHTAEDSGTVDAAGVAAVRDLPGAVGRWRAWRTRADRVAYYLRGCRLAPGRDLPTRDLPTRIRAVGPPPVPDGVAPFRVTSFLTRPRPAPVWRQPHLTGAA